MPEGETEETCKEHIEALKKEMARKTNKNMALIRKLMELIIARRRTTILKETVAVSKLLEIYPALKLQSTVKEEFGRILGKPNPVKYIANTFKEVWVQKILKYGLMQTVGITVKALVDEALEDNPDRKNAIEEAAAVYLLPHLLKEKGESAENFIKLCTDDESIDKAIEETKTPRIVCSGEFWCLDPLYIAAEGVVLISLGGSSSLANALGLLVASYYIFNIKYPVKCTNAYIFCEATLLGNEQEAKKRVTVNKFISALD